MLDCVPSRQAYLLGRIWFLSVNSYKRQFRFHTLGPMKNISTMNAWKLYKRDIKTSSSIIIIIGTILSTESVGAAEAVSWAVGHNPGRVTTPTQDTRMAQLSQQAGIQFADLGRMTGWVNPLVCINSEANGAWTQDPWIPSRYPNHWADTRLFLSILTFISSHYFSIYFCLTRCSLYLNAYRKRRHDPSALTLAQSPSLTPHRQTQAVT